MWNTFPLFCTTLLLGVMVCASYTFAISLAAGASGRPRTLQAARFGAYGTVALITTAVLCLAYAFVSHDFRLRYVAHYSDRGMPLEYLLTALWGGQDGSLLWWLFLLSLYIGVCVRALGKKYLELQPYVIATLMAVVLFFCVLMAFAANPFSTSVAGARNDGEGLNPLLQNYWMVIHPPSLYTGFVGCTVPFSFAIAALVTGRLDQEWIVASRRFTLFSWMFLGIGNTLGMIWAYEELGWGGYWAWDPVENAAFMPFLTASAFIHSVMIQERRGLLKVWNVFLVSLTFLMTIFGTFLTRSGAIASVHSFAQSSIGTYFVWFIALAAAVTATLIFYRWPELRDLPASPRLRKAAVAAGWVGLIAGGPAAAFASNHLPMPIVSFAVIEGIVAWVAVELVYRRMTAGLKLRSATPQIESILSREFTFLLNNYALLGFMLFVCVATTFPMISEAFWNEKVTVGPPYYNAWVQPIGLVIFALMGIGTLLGWKKTSPQLLRKAFFWPMLGSLSAVILLALFGKKIGFAAVVWGEPIYTGALGQGLRAFNAITPTLGVALVAFNVSVIAQEFTMLFRSRAKSGADKAVPSVLWYAGLLPGFLYTLITLPPPSRRRYGGYVVHLGIVLMFLGFTGKSWTVDKEATLSPGQTIQIDHYKLEYINERMEVDLTKRMIFADVKVTDLNNGKQLGVSSPAKFIYKKSPDAPTTEVAQLHSIRDDLYLVVGSVNPQTHVASFQVHVNPLVGWIWFGCIVLIFGSIICMWPQLEPEESRAWSFVRSGTAVAASVTLGIILALMPVPAFAQSAPTGSVAMRNDREREVFQSLRCMCGGCQRLPLSTCGCGDSMPVLAEIRAQMAAGMSDDAIRLAYVAKWGQDGLTVPPNRGPLRAIYLFPLGAIAAGGVGLAVLLRRWRRPSAGAALGGQAPGTTTSGRDEYDARLDQELKDLDD
ncbi:MAG: cytochrome c-type biogenesis CcmF C-terminal domain-containing protein [Polyangiaceae bacterium]